MSLEELREISDCRGPWPITSHRPVVGPLIVLMKRLLRLIATPFAKVVLARQATFNEALVDYVAGLEAEIRGALKRIEEGVGGVSRQVEGVDRRVEGVDRRVAEMDECWEEVNQRLDWLRRQWEEKLLSGRGPNGPSRPAP